MEAEINKLVGVVEKFKPGKPLSTYISHIRFPKFKGMERFAEVRFDFPLTALVGPNGAGKTSVLHALYGAPHGNTTARFWFETELDKIEGPRKDPQRFVYGHWNESYKAIVETRKARLGVVRDYDYWEPYRSSKADRMPVMPEGDYEGRSKDRWNPVKRDVVYINSKLTIGSFDKYFNADSKMDHGARRSEMRNLAARLNSIKKKGLQSYTLGRGGERLFLNRDLSDAELREVNRIVGKNYDGARIIEHSIYSGSLERNLTVVFQRGIEYSEAYAGSGEVSAVSVVIKLLAAEPQSLILLDEPETSLHPGAQRALLRFILEQIKEKKHQVVISTHSGDLVHGLPDAAICVFEDNGAGKTRVVNGCSPLIALNRLGRVPTGKLRILVEDPLAEMIVRRAIEGLDKAERDIVDVRVAPGGAEAIAAHHGPGAMLTDDDVYVLLDGDQRKVPEFTDPDTIAPIDLVNVIGLIKVEIGCEPRFLLAGGNDKQGKEEAEIRAGVSYLKWLRSRLAYLPKLCPEQILIDSIEGGSDGGGAKSSQCKSYLNDMLAEGVANLTSQDMLSLMKVKVAHMSLESEDMIEIKSQIRSWIAARK